MIFRGASATRFIAAVIGTFGVSVSVAVFSGGAVFAEDTIRGKANIIDGDTLEIAGIPVRLEGIDAPEQRQNCTGDKDRKVACGKLATEALARLIGNAPVTCIPLGRDSYDRLLGECSTGGQRATGIIISTLPSLVSAS